MNNKSIVFVNPPSPFLIDDLVMPPLGIMYLSSYMKSKGFETNIHDFASTNKPIPDADIIAFTSTTPQYKYVLDILNDKKNNINEDTLTIIGGAHSSCFNNCLKDGFKVEIVGEGEIALTNICSNNTINNVSIAGSPIEDLNSLPYPDREWDGFKDYKYKYKNYNFTTSMTSRGCPYNCGFCYKHFGSLLRYFSVYKVLEEAKIIKNMGFDGIMYYDDTFSINKKRAIKIAEGLKQIGLKFRCFIHANTVNYDFLKSLKNNGCVEVGMGVESGSQEILNIINKKITVEQIENVISICKEINLDIKTFLMVGLPGENYETVEATKRLILKTKPTDFDISLYTPFPKTEIWNNKKLLDISFKTPIDYSKMFYKSHGVYKSNVRTKSLSYEDLERCRIEIELLKDNY